MTDHRITTDIRDEDGRTRHGAPPVRWLFSLSARPEIARMNQCPACNADPHQLCYGRTFSRRRTVNHSERKAFAITIALTAMSKHRTYVDALNTSNGALVSSPACEHCDGEKSAWVRYDTTTNRGWVCPVCDDALDEMYPESSKEQSP